ncbi:MAG: tRNA lysidine(34) synthetase TilS [Gemmatimonadota bacterium]|nr:MAG: tRNA lysidine(34) synthetase TilS [Gemmatimonadota bacterium]
MSKADAGLSRRFVEHVAARRLFSTGERVVVAVSGGADSTALLHLLRFSPGLPDLEFVAAHFDHRMRRESASDVAWLRGLTLAWGIEFRSGQASVDLTGEEQARDARYAFLEAVATRTGASKIATGHHEDDQAETVLFRIARGTGLAGLSGIPETREPGIVRPLLPFRRTEIETYLATHRLVTRDDESNLDPRFARNVLRHQVIPLIEKRIAPGVTASLVRLARLADREEAGWRCVVPELLDRLVQSRDEGVLSVDRPALLAYHSVVQARLLRAAIERFGVRLDEAGTSAVLEFARAGASGRNLRLQGALVLRRSFDELLLSIEGVREEHRPLEIPEPGSGSGGFVVGGRHMTADWSVGEPPEGRWVERFSVSQLEFPASFRQWSPGDRMRLPYGSKKLKKVFAEARVPAHERIRRPVLVDGGGSVLWIPGVMRSCTAEVTEGGAALSIAVAEVS